MREATEGNAPGSALVGGYDVDRGYLNTATVGIPPPVAVTAMETCLALWRRGRLDPARFDEDVAVSRALFAGLVGVPPDWVATGSQVSAFAGLVAAALRPGAEVLCAEEDFTSVLFPFLAQARRGVTVRTVPLEALVAEVRPTTDLVAVSLVQSADGRVLDLDALVAAAAAVGAATFLDATQAVGWLPVDAGRVDYLVCGAYKWLCAPRGTAFFVARPERWDKIVPHFAGWYAGADVWSSVYGPPLRLAPDARRFDLSPAWFCWAGARPALEALAGVGVAAVHDHDVALADRFRSGLGLAPAPIASAIVAVDVPGAQARLEAAGVRASLRAGRTRVSFHLYTTAADVDAAVVALV